MRTICRREGTMERHLGRLTTAAYGELPRDALLTADEVAKWLKVARRQVQRLGIPWIDLGRDRKSTRLNSSHTVISYAVFCLKKKKRTKIRLQYQRHHS